MIKTLRKIGVVFVALLFTVAGTYWFWTTTAYYSFQQAFFAVLDKDISRFISYVDVDSVVDNLLDDLITKPAESTPGLSETQREVGLGAIAMTRVRIANDLKIGLRRLFIAYRQPPTAFDLIAPAQAQDADGQYSSAKDQDDKANGTTRHGDAQGHSFAESESGPAHHSSGAITTDSVKELLNVVGRGVNETATRRKTEAYERMTVYLRRHPDTILGKILNAPADRRSLVVQDMLLQYGFTRDNFKGLVPCITSGDGTGAEKSIAGFVFASPKLGDDLVIQVELTKGYNSSVWRIKRISNVPELLQRLEPTYESDVHNLVAYSLVGISNKNLNSDLRGVTEKIKASPAARKILERFHIR